MDDPDAEPQDEFGASETPRDPESPASDVAAKGPTADERPQDPPRSPTPASNAILRLHVPDTVMESARRAQREAAKFFRLGEQHLAFQQRMSNALASITRQQTQIDEAVRISSQYAAMRRQIEETYAPLTRAVRSWELALETRQTIERITREYRESLPPNWPGGIALKDTIALVEATGWALVWVPDEPVIAALLATADHELRVEVLLSHAGDIVRSVEHRVAEVDDDELAYLAECVGEAAESLSAGYGRASQTLSASVLTGLLQGALGYESFNKARKELQSHTWDATSMPYLRYALIASTIPGSLDRFLPGDDVPDKFNRHAVAHHPSPVQLTNLNALVALMLVAALVRELDELARRGLFRAEEAQ